MSQLFVVHPENPQPRALAQAAELLAKGGLLAIPTDSSYAVVARLDDKSAADSLRRLRGLDDRHHLTLLCRDLAEIIHFAKVDNRRFPACWSWRPQVLEPAVGSGLEYRVVTVSPHVNQLVLGSLTRK